MLVLIKFNDKTYANTKLFGSPFCFNDSSLKKKKLMMHVTQHELCSMLTCHKSEQDIKHENP